MISARTISILEAAITDATAVAELVKASKNPVTAQTRVNANTMSATSGSLPTPDGATLFANAASPTNAELLDAVVELRAKVALICTTLTAAGVTL